MFFFKQKTAYEMRISDWSSDVCSSDLVIGETEPRSRIEQAADAEHRVHQEPAQRCLGARHLALGEVVDQDQRRTQMVQQIADHVLAEIRDRKSTRLNSSH